MFAFLALTLDALAVPAQTLVAEDLGRADGERGATVVATRAVRLSLMAAAVLALVAGAARRRCSRTPSPTTPP